MTTKGVVCVRVPACSRIHFGRRRGQLGPWVVSFVSAQGGPVAGDSSARNDLRLYRRRDRATWIYEARVVAVSGNNTDSPWPRSLQSSRARTGNSFVREGEASCASRDERMVARQSNKRITPAGYATSDGTSGSRPKWPARAVTVKDGRRPSRSGQMRNTFRFLAPDAGTARI